MSSARILRIGMPGSRAEAPGEASTSEGGQILANLSPCGQCSRRCCAEYTVTVTGFDIYRIAATLKMAPEQFIIYFPAGKDSEEGFKLDQSGDTYCVALDKAPGEAPYHPCVFLLELPGGFSRCGIYSCRPQVCRTFPAYLDGDAVSLRHDVLCPEGTWKLSQMNLDLWRRRLCHFRMERDIYSYVVEWWNGRVDRAEPGRQFYIQEYYAFLMNVYSRLEDLKETVSEKEWSRVLFEWGTAPAGQGNPFKGEIKKELEQPSRSWLDYVERIRNTVQDFFPSGRSRPEETVTSTPLEPEPVETLSQQAAQASPGS